MQLHLFHVKETDCRSVFLYLMLFSPMSLSLFVLSSALNNNKNTTHLLHTINTHKAIIAFSHLKVCSIQSIVNKITTQWLTREEKKKKFEDKNYPKDNNGNQKLKCILELIVSIDIWLQ